MPLRTGSPARLWFSWLDKLFGRRRRVRATSRPRVEELETRCLLSTSFSIGDTAVQASTTGSVNLVYTVTRSGDTNLAATLDYSSADGSAKAGIDYTSVSGAVFFPSGALSETISVPVTAEMMANVSDTKTVLLNLTGVAYVGGNTPAFAGPTNFTVGQAAFAVAVGDFNGDGKPDLAVANYGTNTLSVLLNQTPTGAATPSFAITTITVGSHPSSVAVGDFNGDGKTDIAVANSGSGTLSVLFNQTAPGAATASFVVASTTVGSGPFPNEVAVGDFNGDGQTDIAVANFAAGTVTVLANQIAPGATTLNFAASTISVGGNPSVVLAGDFNGDGQTDIAVASYTGNTLSVLLNQTTPGAVTPTFSMSTVSDGGGGPFGGAVGDFNGDGKPDIALADFASGQVAVLLDTTAPGAATASFSLSSVSVGPGPTAVAVGDFNGDGHPDLAVASNGSNSVVLLNETPPGAATPTFAVNTVPPTYGALGVAVGDFNGDGKTGLAITREGAGQVEVLLNTTTPAYTAPAFSGLISPVSPSMSQITYSVVVADFNGDGRPDIAYFAFNYGARQAIVLLNTTAPGSPNLTFGTPFVFTIGNSFHGQSLAVADFNGDGKPDLVVGTGATATVLLNTTAPGATVASFIPYTVATTGQPGSVAVGDFNGDGKPDLVITNYFNSMQVLLNTTPQGAATPGSALTFATSSFSFLGEATSAVVGDFNGDGKPDIAVANFNNSDVLVYINQTTPSMATAGSVASFAVTTIGSTFPRSLAVGDFNGDGKLDLAVAQDNPTASTNQVAILMNQTAPGAVTPVFSTTAFTVGKDLNAVAVGDVNGDGLPDVLVSTGGQGGNSVDLLLNQTTPGATTPSFGVSTIGSSYHPSSVAVGDINGDGFPDVLFGGTLYAILNQPATIVVGQATGTITQMSGPPTVSLTQSTTQFSEAGGTDTVTATLNITSATDVTVTLGFAGSNYTESGATILIAAGSTQGSITLTGVDDHKFDPDTTATVSISGAVNATVGAPSSVSATVLNSDPQPTVSLGIASTTFAENGGTDTVTATLNTVSGEDTTVTLNFAGSNYTESATTIVITAGSTQGSITLTGVDDHIFDPDTTATVSISGVSNATVGSPSSVSATVLNSDPQPTVQFNASSESVNETDDAFSISVTLSGPSYTAISIPFTLGGTAVAGTDYSSVTASPLVIPAGQTTGTITGNLHNNGLYALATNETLTVTLGVPTNGTLGVLSTNTLTVNKVSPQPSIPGLTTQERYIQALYLDELGRAGSVTELDFWVAKLNGPGGALAVTTGIKSSPEATDYLVKSWYHLYLGRSAANGEELGWTNMLQQGQTEEAVLSQILSSTEFYTNAQTLVPSGTADERFVQALYLRVLRRAAQPNEVATQVAALPMLGRQGLALEFLQSTEFRTKLFAEYYQGLLHRQGSSDEVLYWVNLPLDVTSVRGGPHMLINSNPFETSPEFMDHG